MKLMKYLLQGLLVLICVTVMSSIVHSEIWVSNTAVTDGKLDLRDRDVAFIPTLRTNYGQMFTRSDGFLYFLSSDGNLYNVLLGGSASLASMVDVLLTASATDQVLTYDGTQWINKDPYFLLNQILDVTIAGAATGEVLTFDGSGWINAAPITSLSALNDVNLGPLATNDVLSYDGTEWINAAPVTALGSLSDVSLGALATDQLLSYNGTSWDNSKSLTGTNSGDVTIATANGLSITGQALSMDLASISTVGSLATADFITFNNKENAIATGDVATFWNGTKSFSTVNSSVVAYAAATPSNWVATQTVVNTAMDELAGRVKTVEGSSVSIAIGAIDSATPNANALSYATGTLVTQSASATMPGMVATGTQVFSGQKSFVESIKADGNLFSKDVEYLANGNAASSTNGWTSYAMSTPAAIPAFPAVGTPTAGMWTRNTTNAINGTSDFLLTHTASNQQGMGVYYDMPIAPMSRGKTLAVNLSAQLASGTYTSGDIKLYAFDVTGTPAALNNGNPINSIGDTTVSGNALQSNQTLDLGAQLQIPVQSTPISTIRLVAHQTSTNATAYNIQVGRVSVNTNVMKAINISNSKYLGELTTTGSWTTNTTYIGKYWQEGDFLVADVSVNLAGAPNSATLTINIPNGYVIDTVKLADSSTGATYNHLPCGITTILDSGSFNWTSSPVLLNTTTSIRPTYDNGSSAISSITQESPQTFANGDVVRITYKVPIQGWTATSQNIVTPAKSNAKNAAIYIPTFTGFGTVSSSNITWEQIGQYVHINGSFVPGTVTATEARVSLPTVNGVQLVSDSLYPALSVVGIGGVSNGYSGTVAPLIETSKSYITFGGSAASILIKQNANAIFTGGVTASFDAWVRISGWSMESQFLGAMPNVVKGAVPNMREYWARIDATSGTPTIAYSYGAWISSITDNGAGDATLNFVSGICTQEPICQVTPLRVASHNVCAGQSSIPTTSNLRVWTDDCNGVYADWGFSIYCSCVGNP